MSSEIIQSIVVSVSAATASLCALAGLVTWRRETRWKDDREIARMVIRGTIAVREAFKHVRNPVGNYYGPAPIDDDCPPDRLRYQQLVHEYENRWKVMRDAFKDLEEAVVEAEVLWGKDIAELMTEVRLRRFDLQWAIEKYTDQEKPNGRQLEDEEYRQVFGVMYFTRNDHFANEIDKALDSVADIAKPRLLGPKWNEWY
ncbi:MAG: hypothetical protein KDA93_12725 [Planctomycetaceae bacterium]|nr:hypothetical protein [Planctomycetaceae bacterium]